MYNLFLDDERNPNKFLNDIRTWDIARNHSEFIRTIQRRGLPKFISFDHDLIGNRTGYDCAAWLIEYCMKTSQEIPEYQVHSMNPVGKANIIGLLENYKNKFQNID